MNILNWFKNPVKEEVVEKVIEEVKEPENEGPYIRIVGEKFDPVNGLELEFDWNNEFVKLLRDTGYTGTSDESIVQKWLQVFAQDCADKVRDQSIIKGDYQ